MPEEVIIEQASAGAVTEANAVLVANTDHTLAVANDSRDVLTISADVADVWVSEGAVAAVLHKGVVVRAGGGPYEVKDWKGEVHVISAGAANIGVQETSYHAGDDQGEEQPGADTFVPSGPSDNYFQRAVPTAPPPGTPYPPNA